MSAVESALVAHTIREKTKLLARVRPIKGQCEAIERALVDEAACSSTLALIASARGAMNGLMAEVLEEHLRAHVLNARSAGARDIAADELLNVVRTYLK
jgi:DNA-binding FrmR family transcriptional regulator